MRKDYLDLNNIKYLDYKDIDVLKKFLTPNGKIIKHKRSGVSSKNQRQVALAIKRARFLGLLPYIIK